MRKWTKSACVVLAGCVLSALMAAGMMGSVRSAPANHRIASSITQVTLASSVSTTTSRATAPRAAATARYVVQPGDTLSGIAAALTVHGGWQALYAANRPRIGTNPNVIHPGTVLVLPGSAAPVRYTVAAGDTLSGIAARLALPGGWRALYAANRRAIGGDPNLLRPGAVLVTARPAASTASPVPPPSRSGQGHQQPAPAQPRPSAPATTKPSGNASYPTAATRLPRWLQALLLSAGLLIAVTFLSEPAMMLGRRRRRAREARKAREAVEKARIVLADHERLIVTYSTADDTVYVLTPPGEDPRAVLRAARLVLPDDTYEVLAGHLGVPANWPLE